MSRDCLVHVACDLEGSMLFIPLCHHFYHHHFVSSSDENTLTEICIHEKTEDVRMISQYQSFTISPIHIETKYSRIGRSLHTYIESNRLPCGIVIWMGIYYSSD